MSLYLLQFYHTVADYTGLTTFYVLAVQQGKTVHKTATERQIDRKANRYRKIDTEQIQKGKQIGKVRQIETQSAKEERR